LAKLILPLEGDTEDVVDLGDRVSVRLGRAATSDVVVPRRMASRDHAQIEIDDGAYTLIDRGSYNGTFINERPISRAPLQHGDRIRIGSYVIRFHADDAATPPELDETQPGDQPTPVIEVPARPEPTLDTVDAGAGAVDAVETGIEATASSWDGAPSEPLKTAVFQLPDDLDAHFDALLSGDGGSLPDATAPIDSVLEHDVAHGELSLDDFAGVVDAGSPADSAVGASSEPLPNTDLELEDLLSADDIEARPVRTETRPGPQRRRPTQPAQPTPTARPASASPLADWRFWAALALLTLVVTLLIRS